MVNEYLSNRTLPEVAALLGEAQNVWLTTHAKPDGDAFGCVVALAAALKQMGKNVTAWFVPPVPATLTQLRGSGLAQILNNHNPTPDVSHPTPDLLVILDTGAWAQLSPLRPVLEPHLARTLILDHHPTGDVPAAWRYVDVQAAACTEIVAQVLDALAQGPAAGRDLFDPTVCEAIFVGIASDTGWFCFSNTRAFTHELAARLMRLGVDQADLYQKLEQMDRPEKLALMIRALRSLRLIADGRAALMSLHACDFSDTGALLEETEHIVDLPQSVVDVRVVALITETPEENKGAANMAPPTKSKSAMPNAESSDTDLPLIRMSFRSKPGPDAVDVGQLAQQFGGGGHARAAGAKVRGTMQEVTARVVQVISTAIAPTRD